MFLGISKAFKLCFTRNIIVLEKITVHLIRVLVSVGLNLTSMIDRS